jgi:hypothetical protein
VDVAGTVGYVRRPHLVGAITMKVRAALADHRPERHLADIDELIKIAGPNRRRLRDEVADKDRHWYRRLLARDGAVQSDKTREVLVYWIGKP